MKNSLHSLIREAFNLAYQKHKFIKETKVLEEGAKEKGEELARIDPNAKAAADSVLNKIIQRPDNALKYKWSPQGAPGLSTPQLNYVIDSLLELYVSTKDAKYKQALSYIYSPFSEGTTRDGQKRVYPALYNRIEYKLRNLHGLQDLVDKNPEIFEELVTKAWGRLFGGGTVIPAKGASAGQKIDFFDRQVEAYMQNPASTFGAWIIQTLERETMNLLRREMKKGPTVSMDKPMAGSGKNHDFGGEFDDSGSDVAGDESEDELFGSTIGDSNDEYEEKNNLNHETWNTAIQEIIDIALTQGIVKTDTQKAALAIFGDLLLHGLNYDEIVTKHPEFSEIFSKRKPNDLLRDFVVKAEKFKTLCKTIEAKYKIPSVLNALFPVVDQRSKTDLETAFKTYKQTYVNVVKNILKKGMTDNLADTDSLLAFEGFFLDGLTFDEIAQENPGHFKSTTPEKALDKLTSNEAFVRMSAEVSTAFGFDKNIWDFFKRAKKKDSERNKTGAATIFKTTKQTNTPNDNTTSDEEEEETADDSYVWEQFIEKHMNIIMERIYKRIK